MVFPCTYVYNMWWEHRHGNTRIIGSFSFRIQTKYITRLKFNIKLYPFSGRFQIYNEDKSHSGE